MAANLALPRLPFCTCLCDCVYLTYCNYLGPYVLYSCIYMHKSQLVISVFTHKKYTEKGQNEMETKRSETPKPMEQVATFCSIRTIPSHL